MSKVKLLSPISGVMFPTMPYMAGKLTHGADPNSSIRDPYETKIRFLEKLMKLGHESPFEHVLFTFHITGLSRACTAQLNRHRLVSICELSQRYVDMGNVEFLVPETIRDDEDALHTFVKATEQCREAYKELVEVHGIPKEDARALLPMSTESQEVFSCNLREFFHIRRLRLCSKAQKEIRDLVALMSVALVECYPDLAILFKMALPDCARCKDPCKHTSKEI